MEKTILTNLDQIEEEYRVKIILACESGSRAWGFPSKDSDYDVRFIYVNPRDWYLSISEKRDVIELPIDNELDINGWDLRKALQLLRKSNSPLLEWLSSPIRYRNLNSALAPIIKLSKKAFMPKSSCYNYLSVAKNSISKVQNNKRIKIKTYMYAIRTIFCCKWIVENLNQPPMHINELLSGLLTDNELREAINRLISIKMENTEKYLVQRSPLIDEYLADHLAGLSERIPENFTKPEIEEFDMVFRKILNEVSI